MGLKVNQTLQGKKSAELEDIVIKPPKVRKRKTIQQGNEQGFGELWSNKQPESVGEPQEKAGEGQRTEKYIHV